MDWNAFHETHTIIVQMEFGSKLYGTQLPSSDTDQKFVFLPSPQSLILGQPEKHFQQCTNKDRNHSRNSKDDFDIEGFSLANYLNFAAEGQTWAMDMLFAPEQFLLQKSSIWETICRGRHLIVSKQIQPFIGYCRTQMNKYCVKAERLNAVKTVVEALSSLPRKQLLGDFRDRLPDIPEFTEKNDAHFVCCGKKADWNSDVGHAFLIYSNTLSRYGERAKTAATGNIDWKSVYHAVRVCFEAEELLKTNFITFPRPEAEYLLKIRRDEIPFQEVQELIEEKVILLDELLKTSTLPEWANASWISWLIMNSHLNHIYGHRLSC